MVGFIATIQSFIGGVRFLSKISQKWLLEEVIKEVLVKTAQLQEVKGG